MTKKLNKELGLKDRISKILLKKGYFPRCTLEEGQEQIDCVISGTKFAFFYALNDSDIGYDVVFEPDTPVSGELFDTYAEELRNEKAPFTDLLVDEFGLIHLYGEIGSDEYTDEFVEGIVQTLERTDGIVAKLKNISYIWED